MAKGKLKTAVLGLNPQGLLMLKAASETGFFHIDAVADKDTFLAEKTAEEYNCTPFDDYRQFIIQSDAQCLLIAAPIHTCEEYIKMAVKKKFPILKLAPPAISIQQTASLANLAESEKTTFDIANPLRFAKSFNRLEQSIKQQDLPQVCLITAFYSTQRTSPQPWQTDPQLAGGGVLLQDAYSLIDQIILNFGMPQQVYSLNTNQAEDRQQRLSLTEDTAILTMKFSDSIIANIIATNTFGSGEQFLKIHTKNKILTATDSEFSITDALGKTIESQKNTADTAENLRKMLISFAQSLLTPDKNKFESTVRHNLKNMAVIESAYLSARTRMPEESEKVLQMWLSEESFN